MSRKTCYVILQINEIIYNIDECEIAEARFLLYLVFSDCNYVSMKTT